ncbi:MAG: LapA family protein [Saprospiraceae bacterium]|nr:LapA family protein [Saprospiraceae bacterium]
MRGTLVAALILAILVTLFVLKNNNIVTINYLFGQKNFSLPVLLFALLGLGGIITFLASFPSWYRSRKQIGRLKKEVHKLTSELNETRAELLKLKPSSASNEDVDDFTKDVETEY